jgi:glutathione synthase/RimK-type ligase-like ATP-grasp enzyme
MKIAIHHRNGSFSNRWIHYCEQENIRYKLVNCYATDIITQLDDCDALMWHFHQSDPKGVLFAKQLMFSLHKSGKKVFPDFYTCWHFDDKVGQMYLLESVDAPLVPSYIFYEKKRAMEWAEKAEFPKVFKLRRGSGSDHVKLVQDKNAAKKLIRQAFGKGFSQYNASANLRERWRKFKLGKINISDLSKGVIRLGYTTEFARTIGNEIGYVYFQDFIEGNDHDIRVNVVDGKAFAVKRGVRENDFRASGSGFPSYEKHNFSDKVIQIAQEVTKKLKMQSVAFDFLKHGDSYLISEISYGFCDMTRKCVGFWDEDMNFHEGSFFEEDWMVDALTREIKQKEVYQLEDHG